MKIFSIVALGLISAAYCQADIKVIGPGREALSVEFEAGLNLVEALFGKGSLTCSSIRVSRGSSVFVVDLAGLLAVPERGWSMEDGDIVMIPEHIFPCMDEADSAAFFSLFDEYVKIKNQQMAKPADWQQMIDKLPTHIKKKEPALGD
jgi:hypothetical protein